MLQTRVCARDIDCCCIADALFCFLFLIPLSRRILRSLLLSENKRDRIETLTKYTKWSQFAVDFFFDNVT